MTDLRLGTLRCRLLLLLLIVQMAQVLLCLFPGLGVYIGHKFKVCNSTTVLQEVQML